MSNCIEKYVERILLTTQIIPVYNNTISNPSAEVLLP